MQAFPNGPYIQEMEPNHPSIHQFLQAHSFAYALMRDQTEDRPSNRDAHRAAMQLINLSRLDDLTDTTEGNVVPHPDGDGNRHHRLPGNAVVAAALGLHGIHTRYLNYGRPIPNLSATSMNGGRQIFQEAPQPPFPRVNIHAVAMLAEWTPELARQHIISDLRLWANIPIELDELETLHQIAYQIAVVTEEVYTAMVTNTRSFDHRKVFSLYQGFRSRLLEFFPADYFENEPPYGELPLHPQVIIRRVIAGAFSRIAAARQTARTTHNAALRPDWKPLKFTPRPEHSVDIAKLQAVQRSLAALDIDEWADLLVQDDEGEAAVSADLRTPTPSPSNISDEPMV